MRMLHDNVFFGGRARVRVLPALVEICLVAADAALAFSTFELVSDSTLIGLVAAAACVIVLVRSSDEAGLRSAGGSRAVTVLLALLVLAIIVSVAAVRASVGMGPSPTQAQGLAGAILANRVDAGLSNLLIALVLAVCMLAVSLLRFCRARDLESERLEAERVALTAKREAVREEAFGIARLRGRLEEEHAAACEQARATAAAVRAEALCYAFHRMDADEVDAILDALGAPRDKVGTGAPKLRTNAAIK